MQATGCGPCHPREFLNSSYLCLVGNTLYLRLQTVRLTIYVDFDVDLALGRKNGILLGS